MLMNHYCESKLVWLNCIALTLLTSLAFAKTNAPVTIIPPYVTSAFDQTLISYWQTPDAQAPTLTQRLQAASTWWLNKPYQLFPTGEGEKGAIDQAPLYQTQSFDCTTYVVTVIAMAQSQNIASFQQRYQALMYQQGQVDFYHRNHFATLDFNQNNEMQGILKNITPLLQQNGKSIEQTLTNAINKSAWYQHIGLSRVRLLKAPSTQTLQKIHSLLKQYQQQSKLQNVTTDYIPMTTLVSGQGDMNYHVLNQIPSGSILEVVYADPNDIKRVGTNLQVAHMGFVFKTPQGQIFREASSAYNKVTDVSLNNYLRYLRSNPTILGIHIEAVSAAAAMPVLNAKSRDDSL